MMGRGEQRESFVAGMFVREIGDGRDRPPLVYVHGLGESGLCFEQVARHPVLASWRQIIPDLPGYGRSVRAEQPLGLDAAGDRLLDLLETLGALPAVLIGHSMGGVLLQQLLERRPTAAAAFVNVDGNVSKPDCAFSGQAVESELEAFVERRYARLLDSIYRGGIEDEALRGYYSSLRLADPRAFYRNSQELVTASLPETLARRMAALPCPSLYLAGRPGGACERSIELLRAAEVAIEVIEPSGHWPFIDQPDAFVQRLNVFLTTRGL